MFIKSNQTHDRETRGQNKLGIQKISDCDGSRRLNTEEQKFGTHWNEEIELMLIDIKFSTQLIRQSLEIY